MAYRRTTDSGDDLCPFGNPDGASATPADLTTNFVTFESRARSGGVAIPAAADTRTRVLVGRKGSGKTIYMRRLQLNASKRGDVYADRVQQDVPTTQNVLLFSRWFSDQLLTEYWMQLWLRALIRSVISHLLRNPKLSPQVTNEDRQLLSSAFPELLRSYSAYVSTYSQVNEIIMEHHSQSSITQYLSHPKWAELETVLARILSSSKTISLYLDATDESYSSAPFHWLRCQKGLFYQIMRLLNAESTLGRKLHVTVALRDVVLASVYDDEGSARFRGEPHIQILSWSRDTIKHFLGRKISKLNGVFLSEEKKPANTLEDWLGVDEISSRCNRHTEPLTTYVLRHTRLLPRDIVIFGNMLCHHLIDPVAARTSDIRQLITTVTEASARIFASEQLTICGAELASLLADNKLSPASLGRVQKTAAVNFLKTAISQIGHERFSIKRLREAQRFVNRIHGGNVDVFSLLWTHGLIGYVDNADGSEHHVFYSDQRMDEFRLPLTRSTYVLHPILSRIVRLNPSDKAPIEPL